MFKDVMIDLETMGTEADAPVVSIGAVFFDIEKEKLGPTFQMVINLDDQFKLGRKPSASTIKWWMGQNDAAKKVFSDQGQSPEEVLKLFRDWFNQFKNKPHAWGNGSTFDITILESLFKDVGYREPWEYNKVMDLRTYKRFNVKDSFVKGEVAHDALKDAIAQAEMVIFHSKK